MTIRDTAIDLAEEARLVYVDEDRRKEDSRIDDLALICKKLAELVAASAPEFKEAP